MFKKELKTPLSNLPNCSFECTFLDILKIASVASIYKKDSPFNCNSNKPISLLSNTSKIIVKIVHGGLFFFVESNSYLYELQFGFRNKTFANHVFIHIAKKIREALDQGLLACGVYIDQQKVFDTVTHPILLDKLNYCIIRGIANDYLKSFLINRKQYTTKNAVSSGNLPIAQGESQGAVLGPLLFVIYINDLHKTVINSYVYHFADDTNLHLIDKSHKKNNKLINQK